MTADTNKILELAYKEGQRAIDAQSADHNSISGRASVVGSMNALIATIFVGKGLATSPAEGTSVFLGFSIYEILATSCLLGSLIFVVLAIMPTRGWRTSLSSTWIIEDYIDGESKYSIDDTLRYISEYLFENWQNNERILGRLMSNLHMALILGFVQVIFWALDIRS